jgi:hypothetical protein
MALEGISADKQPSTGSNKRPRLIPAVSAASPVLDSSVSSTTLTDVPTSVDAVIQEATPEVPVASITGGAAGPPMLSHDIATCCDGSASVGDGISVSSVPEETGGILDAALRNDGETASYQSCGRDACDLPEVSGIRQQTSESSTTVTTAPMGSTTVHTNEIERLVPAGSAPALTLCSVPNPHGTHFPIALTEPREVLRGTTLCALSDCDEYPCGAGVSWRHCPRLQEQTHAFLVRESDHTVDYGVPDTRSAALTSAGPIRRPPRAPGEKRKRRAGGGLWIESNWEYVDPVELERRQSAACSLPSVEEMKALWDAEAKSGKRLTRSSISHMK